MKNKNLWLLRFENLLVFLINIPLNILALIIVPLMLFFKIFLIFLEDQVYPIFKANKSVPLIRPRSFKGLF